MKAESIHRSEGTTIEQQLAEIAEATPVLTSELVNTNPLAFLMIVELPHGCSITATLAYEDASLDRSHMYIDNFVVPEPLQRNRIGERLLSYLVLCGRLNAVVSLSGLVTSEAALRTRARVFGKDALHFYDRVPPLNQRGKQSSKSYEQILETLRSNPAEGSLVVEVDLAAINLQDAWQRSAALQSHESTE